MTLYETELPIRADLHAAHVEVLDRWATAGTLWSSEERLAIVTEVRRARDADKLAPWVAPSTVDGLVDPGHPLPSPAIDAVWRITNHPGTLTADWYQSIIEEGLDPVRYVELVGIVAQANCIDRFADALDIARPQLPAAVAASSDAERVADHAAVRTHWVPTVDVDGANVRKALSAVPTENDSTQILSSAHYLPEDALMMDLSSDHHSLTRMQIELIAARTSRLNDCFY